MSNPPHNLLNESVKAELLVAMTALRHDEDVTAVVLTGAGTRFSAGVDLRATAEGERPLADIADLIEAMDKPVVAALHGTVLGGGLELAMACHWRLAAPGVRLGLPGAVVGRLPMAGGSQRLTRLVGPRRTLDMLLTSALLEAEEALALGLIDAVAPGDLVASAIGHARAAVIRKLRLRRTSRLPIDLSEVEPDLFSQLRAQVARGAPGLFALPRCVDAVDAACMLPTTAAMERQTSLAATCRNHPQSRALAHVFFAEREAARLPARPDVEIRSVVLLGDTAKRLGERFAEAEVTVLSDARVGEADLVFVSGRTTTATLRRLVKPRAILACADPAVRDGMALALRITGVAEVMPAMDGALAEAAAVMALAVRVGWAPLLVQRPGAFVTNLLNEAWRRAIAQLTEAGVRADHILRACAALGFNGRPIPVRPPATGRRGPPLPMSDEAILSVCVASIAEEGRRLLGAGVVRSAADIDVAAIHGLGFPRHRGGPMFALEPPAPASLVRR